MKEDRYIFSGWVVAQLERGEFNLFLSNFSRHPLVEEFQEKLGYRFDNNHYFFQALCHRSFVNEQVLSLSSNERLEFFGDSILSLMVSQELLHLYPKWDEGGLSKMRDALVNGEVLAEVAKFLGCSQVVLLGRGEIGQGGHGNPNILADVLESLMAAVYLDSSLATCLKCFQEVFFALRFGLLRGG